MLQTPRQRDGGLASPQALPGAHHMRTCLQAIGMGVSAFHEFASSPDEPGAAAPSSFPAAAAAVPNGHAGPPRFHSDGDDPYSLHFDRCALLFCCTCLCCWDLYKCTCSTCHRTGFSALERRQRSQRHRLACMRAPQRCTAEASSGDTSATRVAPSRLP